MFLWLYSFKVNFSRPTPTTLRWLRAHAGWFLTSLPLILTFTLSLKCWSKLKQLDCSHWNSAFLFFLSSFFAVSKSTCEDGNSIHGMDTVLDTAGQISALTQKGLLGQKNPALREAEQKEALVVQVSILMQKATSKYFFSLWAGQCLWAHSSLLAIPKQDGNKSTKKLSVICHSAHKIVSLQKILLNPVISFQSHVHR